MNSNGDLGTMTASGYFSADYAEARTRFLEAAKAAGARPLGCPAVMGHN